MNKTINNLNISDILFMDIETVRKSETLDIDSQEFQNFQYKVRNKETNELLEYDDVLNLYKMRAPLYLTYNKIVTISVGYVVNGVVRIKAITGEEKDIIQQFCEIANKFKHLCGFNILNFDLPVLMLNGTKYFNMSEILKDDFIVTGKKVWDIKNIHDIFEVTKSFNLSYPSLVDLCLHFGIETPKDDISGADVSRVFYEEENGIERVAKYCNKDVFATINLFQAMRHKERFETFVEVVTGQQKEDTVKEKQYQTLLHELYETKMFNETFKEKLKKVIGKKITKKEKTFLHNLICASYLERISIGDKDAKTKTETNKNRTEEVESFINLL